jgi:hypothetical protein
MTTVEDLAAVLSRKYRSGAAGSRPYVRNAFDFFSVRGVPFAAFAKAGRSCYVTHFIVSFLRFLAQSSR